MESKLIEFKIDYNTTIVAKPFIFEPEDMNGLAKGSLLIYKGKPCKYGVVGDYILVVTEDESPHVVSPYSPSSYEQLYVAVDSVVEYVAQDGYVDEENYALQIASNGRPVLRIVSSPTYGFVSISMLIKADEPPKVLVLF